MPTTTRFFFSAFSLFPLMTLTTSRHIHHRPLHQHVKRYSTGSPLFFDDEAAFATSTTEITVSSATAGDEAIEDIQAIQKGLSDLPENLLDFVHAAQSQLAGFASLLEGYADGQTTVTYTESAAGASTSLLPMPSTTEAIAASTTVSSTTSSMSSSFSTPSPIATSSSSFLPGVVPVVPYETTFRTSRITSTWVRTITVQPSAAASMTGIISPPRNGTSIFTASEGPGRPSGYPVITHTVVAGPGSNGVGYAASTLTTSFTTTAV